METTLNTGEKAMSEGTPFFRCVLCGVVVSKWDIEKHHACQRCGGARIKPTNLSFIEKTLQIIKHPLVWRW